jgi:acetylornithine deacetylase/succinyl-diaminopimelate desuccinylase-like protein
MHDMIKKWAADSQEELKQLIFDLCRIPAPSHKEELRAEFCKNWLESKGAQGVFIDEALNVVLPYCDNGGDVTVFEAHTDTVFPDMTPFEVKVEGDIAFCPGIGDDTTNLAEMMMAIDFLLKNDLKPQNGGIIFVCNSCEEGLGNLKGTRAIMKRYGDRTKEFFTFDGGLYSAVNRAVGSRRFRIEVKTIGGHSYGSFGNPNAIEQLAQLIVQLYRIKVPAVPGTKTTMNVGVINGGTSVNTIAQQAEALFEFRSDDKDCLENMQKQFDAIVEAERVKDRDITVEIVGERPCMGDVDTVRHKAILDKVVNLMSKYTDKEIRLRSSSTDCNIPLSMGIPSICVGCYRGAGAHTREEYVEIESLLPGLKFASELILHHF